VGGGSGGQPAVALQAEFPSSSSAGEFNGTEPGVNFVQEKFADCLPEEHLDVSFRSFGIRTVGGNGNPK
jgi:hypothetical protein